MLALPASEALDRLGGRALLGEERFGVAVAAAQGLAGPRMGGQRLAPGGEPRENSIGRARAGGQLRDLIEEGDPCVATAGDVPSVGLLEACEDLGEGRLA